MKLNNLIIYTIMYTLYIMCGGQRGTVVNPSFAYRDT